MTSESISDWTERMKKMFNKIAYMPDTTIQQLQDYITTLPRQDIQYVANAHVKFVSAAASKVLSTK